MHVWSGVVGKLKIAPSGAVPFGGGEIVPISGVEQSAFGLQKAVLRQPVFELRGETSRQILRYDECTLLRGSGSRCERLMPGLGRLQIAVDAQEFAAHVRFQFAAINFVHSAGGSLSHRRTL